MSFPRIVPTAQDITVTATAYIRHRCPYRDEIDEGTISITWQTRGATFELHSLRAYLDGFADTLISHEALTGAVRHELAQQEPITIVAVESCWDTADMEVRCSTSPTPAGPR
jgi:NADPH-dependent 7-cyano-7-deazaguanine reductase QueF